MIVNNSDGWPYNTEADPECSECKGFGVLYLQYCIDDCPKCIIKKSAIRAKAYLLWEEAGKPEGQNEYFWLQAEKALCL